ncbi:MAG: condensation domain-containing protein [Candidatus Binataceae bacterium]
MSTSVQRIEDLSPLQKRELLSELLQKRADDTASYCPLSCNQQGIWFLYQLAPESSVYNVNFAARITADLDVPALRRAFQTLVDRHPALRTTFPVQLGKPVQRVHGSRKVHFQEVEGSSWTPEELERRLLEEAYSPFDLERGPLLRVSLVSRSEREHILLLVVHHIIIDFWSLAIILEELNILYPAESAGVKAPLPRLESEYTDYVGWQAEMLAGAEGERLWMYWQKQLGGQLPVLELRTDRLRPAIPTYRGASHDLTINAEVSFGLKTLSKAHGATLYTMLLAAFQVLLSYHSGQEDILVGSPMVGRSRPEFEGIVGLFTNPVVLRASLSGNPTFREFLIQVRHTVLDALEHQDFPTVLLVERLRRPRDLSRPPLCQVMFVLDKPHNSAQSGASAFAASETGIRINPAGLVLESVPLERRAATLDLVLLVFETQDSLAVSWRYNTDLFDAATIAQMSRHYETLLRGIIQEPTARIDSLKRTLVNADFQHRTSVLRAQKKVNIQRLTHLKRRAVFTGASE